MKKTRLEMSMGPAVSFPLLACAVPRPAHFTVLLRLHRDPAVEPRKIPVEHFPSPPSPILFKIAAMETHAGNLPRLNRRRQFCARFRSN